MKKIVNSTEPTEEELKLLEIENKFSNEDGEKFIEDVLKNNTTIEDGLYTDLDDITP